MPTQTPTTTGRVGVAGWTSPSVTVASPAPLRDAPALQERVHFIGFVTERHYREGEIRDVGYYRGNWHLFVSHEEAIPACLDGLTELDNTD